mmetsp:Transcript_18115/g.33709  ORF Transcript_18115/g.33709 Transcript_18115/m.33709 type:complete len:231 (-) Transcript_18115:84-776(-)
MERRRKVVLDQIAKDPCALDVIVWAPTPLIPAIVDKLFEVGSSSEKLLRWALVGESEADLRRTLSRCHASVPDFPFGLLPNAPEGLNPYLVPVVDSAAFTTADICTRLVSRTTVVLNASYRPMPSALRDACSTYFVDLVEPAVVSNNMNGQEQAEALVAEILEGAPRCRGGTVVLNTGSEATDMERASQAVAVIQALVKDTMHVDGGGFEVSSEVTAAALELTGLLRARL